jgi:hypothetical protein
MTTAPGMVGTFSELDVYGNLNVGGTISAGMGGGAITTMADGTVGAPGLAFTADTDTGIYRIGANDFAFAAGGAIVLEISTTGIAVTGSTLVGNGTVSLPGVAFASDTDSGLYRIGANDIALGVNGAIVLEVTTAGVAVTGTVLGGNGTVALPEFSFASDTDTGVYRIGANNLGVGVNGAKVLDVSATGLGVTGTTLGGDGTVSLPGFSFSADTDTGVYRIGANNLGVAVNAAKVLDVGTAGLAVTGLVSATTSILSSGATQGIGYATGAGGTVTQATSKATTVVLNKVCGTITMNNASLATVTAVKFTLTNSAIVAATDVVNVDIVSGGTSGSYLVSVGAVAAGSCDIVLFNCSTGTLSEAVVLQFAVQKAVAA